MTKERKKTIRYDLKELRLGKSETRCFHRASVQMYAPLHSSVYVKVHICLIKNGFSLRCRLKRWGKTPNGGAIGRLHVQVENNVGQ